MAVLTTSNGFDAIRDEVVAPLIQFGCNESSACLLTSLKRAYDFSVLIFAVIALISISITGNYAQFLLTRGRRWRPAISAISVGFGVQFIKAVTVVAGAAIGSAPLLALSILLFPAVAILLIVSLPMAYWSGLQTDRTATRISG